MTATIHTPSATCKTVSRERKGRFLIILQVNLSVSIIFLPSVYAQSVHGVGAGTQVGRVDAEQKAHQKAHDYA